MEVSCDINVFTVTFDEFNASKHKKFNFRNVVHIFIDFTLLKFIQQNSV